MSEFTIRFQTLLDMLDFISTTDNASVLVIQDAYLIRGFFSDAEIELAQNGMQGEIKPVDPMGKGT